MAEIATVRAAVGDHRDELIALVRALVWHPSENPKLLAEVGAQLRATAAEAACRADCNKKPAAIARSRS